MSAVVPALNRGAALVVFVMGAGVFAQQVTLRGHMLYLSRQAKRLEICLTLNGVKPVSALSNTLTNQVTLTALPKLHRLELTLIQILDA